MAGKTFRKDPGAVLDFKLDWADWLGTDSISSSDFTVAPGLTFQSKSYTTTSATVWVSGGVAGETYEVTNTITTNGGRTDERTIRVRVRDQ